jgi:hypothetical protein
MRLCVKRGGVEVILASKLAAHFSTSSALAPMFVPVTAPSIATLEVLRSSLTRKKKNYR